ncbi:MAG: hypothetical protein K9K79_06175 [Desulfohalobiaceae bacterium]|nr:hypothetical protein [Desulfohalobiaceae bacterium]
MKSIKKYGDINEAYGGYSATSLALFGWLMVIGIVAVAFVFQICLWQI